MYYVLIDSTNKIVKQAWFDEAPGQPNPIKNVAWYRLVEVTPIPSETEKVSGYTLSIDGDTATKTYLLVSKNKAELALVQKEKDIVDNLPTWQQVSDAIDAVSTIAGLKVVVKKIARVVYWLAKNSAT